MKIEALIKKLQTIAQKHPSIEVLVDGYEGGYASPSVDKPKTFARDVYDEWYYGSCDTVSKYEPHEDKEHFQAIVISRSAKIR